MRRSRASLLLFFATFTSLLLAVGFADGGHESTGRPIDAYRLDIDEAAEGWHCAGAVGLAEDLLYECNPIPEAVAEEGLSLADDWVFLTAPGSPLTVALLLDEETACQLAYEAEALASERVVITEPVVSELAVSDAEFAGCIFGPWFCDYAFAAKLAAERADAVEAMDWRNEATATIEPAPAVNESSEQLALDAAATFAGVPHALVWEEAIEQSRRCQFAWNEVQALPSHTTEGWLAEREELPIAEFCRELGRGTWTLVQWLGESRDRLIADASAELAAWLPKLAESSRQAAIPSDSHADHPTSSAIRVRGPFIAL